MKRYIVTFKKTAWFNGGMNESIVTRELEARNIKSATNKVRKLEAYGKARTWYIMVDIHEA